MNGVTSHELEAICEHHMHSSVASCGFAPIGASGEPRDQMLAFRYRSSHAMLSIETYPDSVAVALYPTRRMSQLPEGRISLQGLLTVRAKSLCPNIPRTYASINALIVERIIAQYASALPVGAGDVLRGAYGSIAELRREESALVSACAELRACVRHEASTVFDRHLSDFGLVQSAWRQNSDVDVVEFRRPRMRLRVVLWRGTQFVANFKPTILHVVLERRRTIRRIRSWIATYEDYDGANIAFQRMGTGEKLHLRRQELSAMLVRYAKALRVSASCLLDETWPSVGEFMQSLEPSIYSPSSAP